MKKFEMKDHEPSYLPEGEWKLVWADEFDGTELDRTKWDFRLNFWGERRSPVLAGIIVTLMFSYLNGFPFSLQNLHDMI